MITEHAGNAYSLILDHKHRTVVPVAIKYEMVCRFEDAEFLKECKQNSWDIAKEFDFGKQAEKLKTLIDEIRENKLIPESEADQLLKFFSSFKEPAYPVDLMDADLPNPDERDMIIKFAEDLIEDMRDLQYVSIGFDDETFLYGLRKDKQGKVIADEMTEARQRRNWLAVAAEFPRIYVDQLKNMVFPTSFVVCFSGENNDSAMWGNYARNHCGVCLVYETDADNMLTVWDKNIGV